MTGVVFSPDAQAAFWSKVSIAGPNECWAWEGAKTPSGYGNVRIDKRYLKAHRVAWEMSISPIPVGLYVCHVCDNPSCCNPAHLMLGSARANFIDMVMKKRSRFRANKAIGERNPNAKLTEAEVAAIRSKYRAKKANQYQLAEQYGVSQPAIGAIVRNETWRHVNG